MQYLVFDYLHLYYVPHNTNQNIIPYASAINKYENLSSRMYTGK